MAGVYMLLGVLDTAVYYTINKISDKKHLNYVKKCIQVYIIQADGEFPGDEKELIEQGVLVKKHVERELYSYYLPKEDILKEIITQVDKQERHTDFGKYQEANYFPEFNIKYGFELNNIVESKGKIYTRGSGKQILLIDGSRTFLDKEFYEKITYELYQTMKKLEKI